MNDVGGGHGLALVLDPVSHCCRCCCSCCLVWVVGWWENGTVVVVVSVHENVHAHQSIQYLAHTLPWTHYATQAETIDCKKRKIDRGRPQHNEQSCFVVGSCGSGGGEGARGNHCHAPKQPWPFCQERVELKGSTSTSNSEFVGGVWFGLGGRCSGRRERRGTKAGRHGDAGNSRLLLWSHPAVRRFPSHEANGIASPSLEFVRMFLSLGDDLACVDISRKA
ncbi:hypothetical protein BHE74_00003226 [Ensete ventricosum]|nr:hypothetical protein GW17_00012040 [Ensete ventricosum]RWW87925.1 hypothetical protein BHE74_00003226 [Ensete ventricosum]